MSDLFVKAVNIPKYRGDNATSGKFLLEIPKTGIYKFSITGSKAEGSVSFKVAD